MAPFSSPFDDYLRHKTPLAPAEMRGLALFKNPDKGNCMSCHTLSDTSSRPERSLFTDFGYDAIAVPRNPKLPANSFDRVLLIHMYHEIEQPYAFLWNLRPALKPGGRVIVVDADRKTAAHGTPAALLACEFAALGYRQADTRALPQAGGYLAAFEAMGPRPAPGAIRPCVARPKE